MMMMIIIIIIIVSVEQLPGWTEHVKVAFLKGPICIHMFVGQPVQATSLSAGTLIESPPNSPKRRIEGAKTLIS